jgi:hypothetical protein
MVALVGLKRLHPLPLARCTTAAKLNVCGTHALSQVNHTSLFVVSAASRQQFIAVQAMPYEYALALWVAV